MTEETDDARKPATNDRTTIAFRFKDGSVSEYTIKDRSRDDLIAAYVAGRDGDDGPKTLQLEYFKNALGETNTTFAAVVSVEDVVEIRQLD